MRKIKEGTLSDIKIIFAGKRYCLVPISYGLYDGVGVVVAGERGYHPISHHNYRAEDCQAAHVEARRANRLVFRLDDEEVADIVESASNIPEC